MLKFFLNFFANMQTFSKDVDIYIKKVVHESII